MRGLQVLLTLLLSLGGVESAISDSRCRIGSTYTSGNVNCVGGEIFLKGQFIEVGIHNVGSYGTAGGAPTGYVYAGRKLGFIADFDKNGFSSAAPGFAGDYFVPGTPVEGWILQWTSSSGAVNNYMMEGLMGRIGMTPTAFQITSTEAIQSALWVGRVGEIEVSKVIQFKNTDVYFSTTVTIKNIGASAVKDLYYMRTVDPDQEQPYYGWFPTRNYVQYQPRAADGSDCCLGRNYVNPSNPNTALVVGVGVNNLNFFCGLGTINSNARVSHWGFYESSPVLAYGDATGNRQWTLYGGNDMQPTSAYVSRMHHADQAIHLTFKYSNLNPGETVQLSYAYVLRTLDLYAAMAGLGAVTITQPTSDISGKSTRITVAIKNLTVSTVNFYVYGVKASTSPTPAYYLVGSLTGSLSSYSVTFDSTVFNDGDVQIQVGVVAAQGPFAAYKAGKISNAGIVMVYTFSDASGTYPFSNSKPTTLNMTNPKPADGNPDSISFYRENFANGNVISILIGTVKKTPWSIRVSCSDLAVGSAISVKAAVSSYSGRYLTSTVFNGVVSFVNNKPTDITLSLTNPTLNENVANGVVAGVFRTSDPDTSQSHTYTLLDNAGGKFSIAGTTLTVNGRIDFETTKSLTILVRTSDGQPTDCCIEKSFTILISDVNEAPISMSPMSIVTAENVPIGTVLASFSTIDPDVGQSFRYSLNVPSSNTVLSTTGLLTVSGTIDYESQGSFTLLVRSSDSGSPNLYLDSIVSVSVVNVNEAPYSITISCNPCIVPENTAKGSTIGSLSTVDPDLGDSFSYSSTSSNPSKELFAISSAGIITVQNPISYQSTGGSVTFSANTRDAGGLTFTQSFKVVIQSVPSAPSSSSVTCYCDENLNVGDIVSSTTRTSPAFCQVSASTNNNAQLLYQIVSNHGVKGNYKGAFSIQSCSGVLLVNSSIDYETYNFYNLTVKITSPGGVSYSRVLIYLVNVNESPILYPRTFTVYENSNPGVLVISSLSENTYDQDDIDPISAAKFCCAKVYSITSGNAEGYFTITSSTGAISVASVGLNYEAKNTYTLTILVTDAGGLTSAATMTINLLDVNEPPSLPLSSGTFGTINENSAKGTRAGSSIVPTDVDIGQTVTLAITSGNIGNVFNLTSTISATGVRSYYFTLRDSIDYETCSIYTLSITATDSGTPPLLTSSTYQIKVNDLNEPPTLTATYTFSIDENSPRYKKVGTPLKSGYSDPDAFSTSLFTISSYGSDTGKNFNINSTNGQLYFDNTLLSYEKTREFSYTIRVTDNGGLYASSIVTIQVIDLPEKPIFNSFIVGSVTENVLGQYVQSNGQSVEYVASDDDGDRLDFTIRSVNEVKSKAETSRFQVRPVTDVSTSLFTDSSFDYEILKDYLVELQVTDRVFNQSQTLTVTVLDANDAPTVSSHQKCYVAQNALALTNICQIVGIDQDSLGSTWGILTYSLLTPIDGLAVISSANIGTLQLTKDNTRNPNLILTGILVRVTDGGGLSAVQNITLTITQVNYPPACPSTAFSFSVNENTLENTQIAVLTGTNGATSITDSSPVGVTLSCSISGGNSEAKFTLSSGCTLRTTSSLLDYEAKNMYVLTVVATENSPNPLSTSCTVTILVVDVNEPTILNDHTFAADENILSGQLQANSIFVAPVVVVDQDPADQHGLFSLVCLSCGNNPISINRTTGIVSLKSGFSLDFEVLNRYQYQINWNNRGVSKTATLTVNINNIPEAPVASSTSISILESTSGVIGYVNVIDPDYVGIINFAGGAVCIDLCGLKYSLTGSTSGSLSIDSNTGAIIILSVGVDFEDADTHSMNIMIKDSSGLTATCVVTVDITDVNDCEVTTLTNSNGATINSANTMGGSQVFINGRNFGPTKRRMSTSAIPTSAVIVSAVLQSASTAALSTYVFEMKCDVFRSGVYDNSRANCTLPEGVGTNLGVIVSVYAQYGSVIKTCQTTFSLSTLSYGPPSISDIGNGILMATTGGSAVVLKGSNFGAKGSAYNLVSGTAFNSFFSSEVGCIVSIAHTELTCISGSGIGSSVSWLVRVGGQVSAPLSGKSSYYFPTITSVVANNLTTVGGETIQISGGNFGNLINRLYVTYGSTSGSEYRTSCIFLAAHTTIQCNSVPGIGKALKFSVKVGDQSSSIFTSSLRYLPPVLDSISGSGASLASTEGGDIFFLTGSQFGPTSDSSSSLLVTYGKSGTEYIAEECKVITAHLKIQCLTSDGTGINHNFFVTIGGQISKRLQTNASYGPPAVSSFSGEGAENAVTNGYQILYVTGTNFGSSMSAISRVYYSEFNGTVFDATQNCTIYDPHRVLKCKTVPGAGKRLIWSIIVDGQLSVSPMTSYSPPSITSLVGHRVQNASVEGGDVVSIIGQNFGPANAIELYHREFLESVTYGMSGTEYKAVDCKVLSNTEISCYTAPGVGESLRWEVTVGGQTSELSTVTMSYAAPKISTIFPESASTDGAAKISLIGSNFAVYSQPKLYFGGRRLTSFSEAKDQVQFFVPVASTVVASEFPVYIDVGGQVSNTVYFHYDPPFIETINSVDSGNNTVILSILGKSFSLSPIVSILPADSSTPVTPYCYKKAHSEIICTISIRAGNVTILVGDVSSNVVSYQFGEPFLVSSSMSSGTALTSGYSSNNHAQLYIIGQNFGASMSESIVLIENPIDSLTAECNIVTFQYVSKTDNPDEWNKVASQVKGLQYNSAEDFQYLTCDLPPGQGKLNSLKVIKGLSKSLGCGCEICTRYTCFSYLPPSISSISPAVGSTSGGYPVIIRGSNFGMIRSVTFGGVSWPIDTSKSNDTIVTVIGQSGEGLFKEVNIQVGNQNNSVQKYFSYGAPEVETPLSSLDVGTAGTSSPITITGKNYGVHGPIVYLNNYLISLISFTHTTLTFQIPPGQGKGLRLSVNVSNQIGYSPDTFSYTPPHIRSASPLNCATNGGRKTNVTVTLIGSNFGFIDLDWQLKVGETAVSISDIVSYSQDVVTFYPPPGQGENLTIMLIVGSQSYTGGPFLFSYNPPKILSLVTPDDKNTAGGYSISFHGLSFGTSGLEVYLYDRFYEVSNSNKYQSPFASQDGRMTPTKCTVTLQTHSLATCTVPPGGGNDLILSFTVNGQSTIHNFSYSPPLIEFFHTSKGGDASGGESLRLYGRNFGAFRTPVNISIGDILCENSVWLVDDPVYNYEPYLKCNTPPTSVGTKNVTVYVAYQRSPPNDRYTVECKAGAFGGVGEYCTGCGDPLLTGLLCDEDNMLWPIASSGWYMSLLATPNSECPTATQTRETCPAVLPCLPSDSCLGNNTCSDGYIGDRCATCADGYYRINGRCEVCPDNPWLIFLVLFLCMSTAGYVAYKLAQKNVNLGILSIGIDYFQVLAVFGAANVSWPPELINMYNSFSVFNFNVDFLAPDCWSANAHLPFKTKWIGITLSPIVVLLMIALFYLGYVVYMRIWKPQIKNHTEMLFKCFALYLMAFYYGYLMLSNNTLAVFNCQPTEPPDGHTYMAEVGPDGGICHKAGSVQQQLEPWAIISFIIYTIGFPAYVAFILYTNSDKCIYAQVMKAAGKRENTDFEKQTLSRFKTLYNRLFYQFKPERYYWVFCILVRKFCLSVSAVIFRENVVFLLAMYMLVLFVSYTAQVMYQPYMSTSEYEEVSIQYAEVISMYTKDSKTPRATRGTKISINRLGETGPMFKLEAPKIEFFNNYNTVESVLLFSAIMVSISAIMFESNELTGSQRDALSYLVILVVAVSLSYFFWVLFTELWVAFYPTIPLLCLKPKKVEETIDTDIEFADISYERQNPNKDGIDNEVKIVRLQTQLETAEGMISQMQTEIGLLKKQKKSDHLSSNNPPIASVKKGKKKTLVPNDDEMVLLVS